MCNYFSIIYNFTSCTMVLWGCFFTKHLFLDSLYKENSLTIWSTQSDNRHTLCMRTEMRQIL